MVEIFHLGSIGMPTTRFCFLPTLNSFLEFFDVNQTGQLPHLFIKFQTH